MRASLPLFLNSYLRDLLSSYSSLVIVSGDGLLFEAVQAVLGRPDADEVRTRLALGIVAGGSGNGLARSLAHQERIS